jgi:hypothetical protein
MAGADGNVASQKKRPPLKILHMECKLIISVANPATTRSAETAALYVYFMGIFSGCMSSL